MATPSTEKKIHDLLLSLGDSERVADQLLTDAKKDNYSEENELQLAHFLLLSGQYPTFFKHFRSLMDRLARDQNSKTPSSADKQIILPWVYLAEAIGQVRIKPLPGETTAIRKGASEQNREAQLLKSYQLDLWDLSFPQRRSELKRGSGQTQKAGESHAEESESETKKQPPSDSPSMTEKDSRQLLQEEKAMLYEKLQFMRDNHMLEQEAQILNELLALYPNDAELGLAKKDLQIRWAKNVIASSTSKKNENLSMLRGGTWPEDNIESALIKSLVIDRSIELASEYPERAYDLAIGLKFMDCPKEALEVLELQKKQPPDKIKSSLMPTDWLYLELLLEARQYLRAFEETKKMEVQYSAAPETAPAIIYSRAQALWGLGQNEPAIELMKTLVRIRPDYKSAQSYLALWIGEES